MIHMVTLHLLFFTDWVADPIKQYAFGWSMIGLIAILVCFNLYFVLKFGIKMVYLGVVKVYGLLQ